MEKLVLNIGPDIQPGDAGTLAVYAGPAGIEKPTGEKVRAQNVRPWVFRSGKFGITDVSRGEQVCGSIQD